MIIIDKNEFIEKLVLLAGAKLNYDEWWNYWIGIREEMWKNNPFEGFDPSNVSGSQIGQFNFLHQWQERAIDYLKKQNIPFEYSNMYFLKAEEEKKSHEEWIKTMQEDRLLPETFVDDETKEYAKNIIKQVINFMANDEFDKISDIVELEPSWFPKNHETIKTYEDAFAFFFKCIKEDLEYKEFKSIDEYDEKNFQADWKLSSPITPRERFLVFYDLTSNSEWTETTIEILFYKKEDNTFKAQIHLMCG